MGILIVLLLVLLVSPCAAHATRYWVAPGGSDATACSSIDGSADPGVYRATPQGGIACLASGDTLTIKSGTYTGTSAEINDFPSGTAGAHTIIEGDPSSAVGCAIAHTCPTIIKRTGTGASTQMYVLNTNYVTLRYLDFDATLEPSIHPIRVGEVSHDWVLQDIEAHDSTLNCILIESRSSLFTLTRVHAHHCGNAGVGHGLYIMADDVVIRNGWFHHNANLGMQCYNSHSTSDGRADRCTVLYSLIEDNVNSGVALEGNDDVFAFNVVRNNGASGVLAGYGGANRIRIVNNFIYNNGGTSGVSLGAGGSTPLADPVVSNNLIFGHGTEITNPAHVTGETLSYNACAAGDSCGTTGKVTIAAITDCLVSASSAVQKTASSCLNVGTNVGYVYNGSAPEIGLEAPAFASCEVRAGAVSTVRVTFTNNQHPPMLPATGATTFTVRKNGASNTITGSVDRVGDNQYDIPVTNSYAGGDTVDISISTNNLTDSVLIGGETNQPFASALSNQSCSNNAASIPYTLTQVDYEYHDWRGLEASPVITPPGLASTGAAENYTGLEIRAGGKIRIRFSVKCGSADCEPVGFQLYANYNGGGYAAIPDTFGSSNIMSCGLPSGADMPSNGDPSTSQLSTTGTFVPGGVMFTSNTIPTVSGLNNGYKTELEYCVAFDSDASNSYLFRVYNQDGTALDAYTNTPTVTIVPAASGGAGM